MNNKPRPSSSTGPQEAAVTTVPPQTPVAAAVLQRAATAAGVPQRLSAAAGILQRAPAAAGILQRAPAAAGVLQRAPVTLGVLQQTPTAAGFLQRASAVTAVPQRGPVVAAVPQRVPAAGVVPQRAPGLHVVPPTPSTSSSTASVGTSGQVRRAIKRPAPLPITNGDVNTWEEKSNDFLCPICFEMFKEAHVTQCGHTYCYDCILTTIDTSPKCPSCAAAITKEQLIPNFQMNQLVAHQRTLKDVKREVSEAGSSVTFTGPQVFQFLQTNYDDLKLGDINVLLTMLTRKKEILTTGDREHQRLLLLEFLNELLKIKTSHKQKLDREVSLLQRDISHITDFTPAYTNSPSQPESCSSSEEGSSSSSKFACFNTSVHKCPETEQATLAARKSRMFTHFNELSAIYLEARNGELFDDRVRINDSIIADEESRLTESDILEDFATSISHISRYHSLRPLATLSYNVDLLSNSNIVSSIEWDKDNEFFAIAGVTKKIKLFEYSNVLGACIEIHYPSAELTCSAKISCIAWSGYYKTSLASSDYDGCVNLWDSASATKTRSMNEHEKRVWSVDWSNGDPRLLASGSDDAKVKLWSTNQEKSVFTLDAKANVCCVKFCPESTFILAFGSADHCIHYYDFRNMRQPLGVLYGHKKAVSYVKFASKTELVSASTDSNLKLWNLERMESVRNFRGHINEKNFVGLATDGNYIACGSENNSLYIYYKSLPKPLFSFKFDNHRGMLEKPKADESTEFVSAVAWKKGSPIVLAANSQGAIKLLELV